jgi:hypothetical protein
MGYTLAEQLGRASHALKYDEEGRLFRTASFMGDWVRIVSCFASIRLSKRRRGRRGGGYFWLLSRSEIPAGVYEGGAEPFA